MTPLAGRLAVVTGSSRGIGLAVADALGAAGAHVVRLARSLAAAESPGRTDVPCDVTSAIAVERAAAEVARHHGPADILVNSAGSFLVKPLLDKLKDQDPSRAYVSTLAVEREINTFFRLTSPGVIAKLREAFPDLPEKPDPRSVFLKLRELRNKW